MTDAVLLVGFGGPENPSQIRSFVLRVLEGRPVPPGRIDEVVDHYLQVGGSSPYIAETRRLAGALSSALARRGRPLEVLTGYRYSDPSLAEQISAASARGVRRLVAVAMTPWGGTDAGDRYRSAVRAALQGDGESIPPVEVRWVPAFHQATGFIAGWVDRIVSAAPKLPDWHLLFTAHSVPVSAAEPYRSQVAFACERIASALDRPAGSWSLAWQSRSGKPDEPWLGPDVSEELARLAADSSPAILAIPIGFLCEHVEILYDLGVEARAVAERYRIPFLVCPAISDHPQLAGHLAGAVCETLS